MADKGLTPKQEKFCREYIKTGNASEAYRLAYDAKNMAAITINKRASELLANSDIAGRIAEINQKAVEQCAMTIADWIKEVKRLSTVDPRKLSHKDGRPKMLHELDDDTAAAIASVEVGVDGIKYKFWDKNAALEKVGKHLGAYERDNQQKSDPINALASAVLGGIVGVSLNQDDDEEDE